MKRVGIHVNTSKEQAVEAARAAFDLLRALGCRPVYGKEIAALLGQGDGFDAAELDWVVVIGGDGTILRACNKYAAHNVPILGVNFGTIGFLSEIEIEDMGAAFKKIADGEYETTYRMRLQGVVDGCAYTALNDFVLYKKIGGHTVQIRAAIDGAEVWNIACDGVIVSTPTGSTAYSLSAGGPVVAHSASVILLTPICAHALGARPIVVESQAEVSLSLTGNEAVLNADGEPLLECFMRGQTLTVRAHKDRIRFITLRPGSFYERVRQKLY